MTEKTMKLTLGNKMYSSWSMRPWMALTAAGIAFEETVLCLDTPEFRATIDRITPAGKVPVLEHDGRVIWDSLAIVEYAAEMFPDAGIWPGDAAARAHARSVSAEMHSGFAALRSACPMNFGKRFARRDRGAAVASDVARITAIWSEARARFGAATAEPFLYGRFCAADAMFAPVVSRFQTYDIAVPGEARAYMEAMTAHPAFVAWREAGLDEQWVVPADEVDEVPVEILRRA